MTIGQQRRHAEEQWKQADSLGAWKSFIIAGLGIVEGRGRIGEKGEAGSTVGKIGQVGLQRA